MDTDEMSTLMPNKIFNKRKAGNPPKLADGKSAKNQIDERAVANKKKIVDIDGVNNASEDAELIDLTGTFNDNYK